MYPECLRKFRLKMSCDGCGYIYMTVVIRIDDRGQLSDYDKTGENVCGRVAPQGLERCFMEYLETITFPENLRGAVIEVRLGTGLKC